MLERLDALLWDAEASKVRELEQTDKSLLETLFQEAFSQKLNKNCQSCWQDAYWQLRWMRKKLMQTPTTMPNLNRYKIIRPFMFIFVRGMGVIKPEQITDELCDKILLVDPDFGQYVQATQPENKIETKPLPPTKRSKK